VTLDAPLRVDWKPQEACSRRRAKRHTTSSDNDNDNDNDNDDNDNGNGNGNGNDKRAGRIIPRCILQADTARCDPSAARRKDFSHARARHH